jgi:hypothetical protein
MHDLPTVHVSERSKTPRPKSQNTDYHRYNIGRAFTRKTPGEWQAVRAVACCVLTTDRLTMAATRRTEGWKYSYRQPADTNSPTKHTDPTVALRTYSSYRQANLSRQVLTPT